MKFGCRLSPSLTESMKLSHLLSQKFTVVAPSTQVIHGWDQWKRSLAFEWVKNPEGVVRPSFMRVYR